MRALLLAVVVLGPALAAAAGPSPELRAKQRQAQEQLLAGEPEAALALVDQGLALAPKSRELLLLRGHVLLKLADYDGALAAYRSYLAAGASGGNRREVLRIISSLESASTTFLRVIVANGPADVRVDARTGRPFCVAAPECRRGILPGDHLLVVDRPGYQRVARRVEVPAAQTTSLELTLVEKPSPLRLRIAPADATVRIDGAPPPAELAPGEHAVAVGRAGFFGHRGTVRAGAGQTIELAITLREGVPIVVTPAGAAITVDGEAVEIIDGLVPLGKVIAARAPGYAAASVTLDPRPATVTLSLRPLGALMDVAGSAGASLIVDGKRLGPLPLAAPFELDPGEHTVEITAPGRKPFRRRLDLPAGQQTTVRVDSLRPRRHTKAWIAAAIGTAGLAAGSAFGILSMEKMKDFDDRAPDSGVSRTDAAQRALERDGDRQALLADISFAVGIAAFAASAYWFRTEGEGLTPGAIEVHAAPAAVSLSGHF